ncbi:GNAT family N-acetyltransferase [Kitasatospora sp. NPDC049285]|uniref:GNAT family N-acetyltransferase n=1 Tax=Kitasatospora sp. NPDC049285 TaxID=3157096 RepID=UPI003449DB76
MPDTAYRRTIPGFGEVRIRSLDPAGDAPLVHSWVTQDRARFWGMRDHTVEQVADIYAYVDSLPSHFAWLVLHDDAPVALFQTYRPEHDPVGECYEVRPGDHGVHLLIGPVAGAARPGYTAVLVGVFLGFVFADPGHLRIVAEPDARNDKAIARLRRTGFTPGPQIDLPDKRAQLMFIDRTAAAGLLI